MKTKNKRIKWLDFAKGIAILFVVLAHCDSTLLYSSQYNLNFLIKIIYYLSFTIVMPLFFVISGFFYKRVTNIHDYLVLLYKKSTSLIIPCVIFMLIATTHISQLLHGNGFNLSRIITTSLSSYLWFLFVLFFIFIIIGTLNLLSINLYIILIAFVILTICQKYFWIIDNFSNITSVVYNTSSYMIFFIFGIIIKKHSNYILNAFKSTSLELVLLIVFCVLIFIQYHITTYKYQTDIITLVDIITKLLSVPILFDIFMNFKHNKLFNYFTKYGRYSLVIYLVQGPLFSILVNHIMNRIMFINNSIIYVLILTIFTWVLSTFVVYVSNRIKLLNVIFYPRKYIDEFIIHKSI